MTTNVGAIKVERSVLAAAGESVVDEAQATAVHGPFFANIETAVDVVFGNDREFRHTTT